MLAVEQCDPRELVGRVERLLDELEHLPDLQAREKATEVVQGVLELYGAGLERIVEEVAARDDGELAQALADDELVAHLLLLHGLHPLGLEERVVAALDEVRPYLHSHGGNVELLAIEEAAVRLRLQGSCSGCPSSTMTLKLAIENAIRKHAPEIEEVIAEDAAAGPPLLQIEVAPAVEGPWTMAGGLSELAGGGTTVKDVGQQSILFLKLGDHFYGYRPRCPACDGSLAEAALDGVELTCAGCGNRYDVVRAGRCLDSPGLHLEPVPLLVDQQGLVKVALPVAA
jgi:Fe-S cluster biogenesis protein NfuA/nitrite reductase/ring-hydroxylating ferredoxin subunit